MSSAVQPPNCLMIIHLNFISTGRPRIWTADKGTQARPTTPPELQSFSSPFSEPRRPQKGFVTRLKKSWRRVAPPFSFSHQVGLSRPVPVTQKLEHIDHIEKTVEIATGGLVAPAGIIRSWCSPSKAVSNPRALSTSRHWWSRPSIFEVS